MTASTVDEARCSHGHRIGCVCVACEDQGCNLIAHQKQVVASLREQVRAPTLSEPRPDDEGRETAPPSFAMLRAMAALRFDGDSLHYLTAMQVRQLGSLLDAFDTATSDVAYFAKEAAQLRRAPAPHPAPLGATDEGLRAAVERIRNLAAFTRHQATQQTGQNARDIRDDADAMDVLLRAALQATP